MNKLTTLLFLLIIWSSCEVKPQEMAYGQDACHFCKMTIVDNQHAAQLVTEKGKAFKYDAIECMMNHLNKWEEPPVKFFLVADYTVPGTLIDAQSANFLISKGIPSPMGEFLTAFESDSERDKALEQFDGKTLSWDELRDHFQIPD